MSSDVNITDSDEGKKVVDSSGKEIGRVAEVSGGQAHVQPDPGVSDTVMSKLGWGSRSEDSFPLDENHIDSVTDDEIRLGSL
ncbi:PRC-barrel domain containing protein [Halosimplex amylolyticum]|uniref:PRC-barrel domain containing protein n=1 Tax=Halosimplex amylolyticum TaxID=3396616 RepID=UPI003F56D55B